MKLVILAGGLGSRLSEETHRIPKPMVEIGGAPILWHIMKSYSAYGVNEFVICLGYKGYVVKEFFANYALHKSDVTFDLSDGSLTVHQSHVDPWKVSLIDTGPETMTGGRLKRAQAHIGDDTFLLTYGDGLSDVNIEELISFHKKEKKLATVTAVLPPGRFGALELAEDFTVTSFREKPKGDDTWINGGFFVLEPGIFNYIENDQTIWEQQSLSKIAKDGQLAGRRHRGFWAAMDTLRDKRELEALWQSGNAPWKNW